VSEQRWAYMPTKLLHVVEQAGSSRSSKHTYIFWSCYISRRWLEIQEPNIWYSGLRRVSYVGWSWIIIIARRIYLPTISKPSFHQGFCKSWLNICGKQNGYGIKYFLFLRKIHQTCVGSGNKKDNGYRKPPNLLQVCAHLHELTELLQMIWNLLL
jgi:hypothetical protein